MNEFVIGLGIFELNLAGSLIGFGYFLGKKILPLYIMLYFIAMFAFLIGTLMLTYPENFHPIFN